MSNPKATAALRVPPAIVSAQLGDDGHSVICQTDKAGALIIDLGTAGANDKEMHARYRAWLAQGNAPAAAVPRPAASHALPRATILERMRASGVFDAFAQELDRPGRRFVRELWYASPTIAASDGRFRELLTAIGADLDVVLAP